MFLKKWVRAFINLFKRKNFEPVKLDAKEIAKLIDLHYIPPIFLTLPTHKTRKWKQRMLAEIDEIIGMTKKYEKERKFEFKVIYDTFIRHVKEAGLRIVRGDKVWPDDDSLGSGGNYVFVLEKAF